MSPEVTPSSRGRDDCSLSPGHDKEQSPNFAEINRGTYSRYFDEALSPLDFSLPNSEVVRDADRHTCTIIFCFIGA